MKKLICAIVLIAACAAKSQTIPAQISFEFIPDRTSAHATAFGQELVYNIPIKNTSTGVITVSIIRRVNNLPTDWSSSMCLEDCFAPFIDSVSSGRILAGQTKDFSMHVTPMTNHGSATIKVIARNESNPADSAVCTLTADFPTDVTSEYKPVNFRLAQNYPNPFNPSTMIEYELPRAGAVKITVYNALGNVVSMPVNSFQSAGTHRIVFNGSRLTSGVYYYSLRTADKVLTRKMLLLR